MSSTPSQQPLELSPELVKQYKEALKRVLPDLRLVVLLTFNAFEEVYEGNGGLASQLPARSASSFVHKQFIGSVRFSLGWH